MRLHFFNKISMSFFGLSHCGIDLDIKRHRNRKSVIGAKVKNKTLDIGNGFNSI